MRISVIRSGKGQGTQRLEWYHRDDILNEWCLIPSHLHDHADMLISAIHNELHQFSKKLKNLLILMTRLSICRCFMSLRALNELQRCLWKGDICGWSVVDDLHLKDSDRSDPGSFPKLLLSSVTNLVPRKSYQPDCWITMGLIETIGGSKAKILCVCIVLCVCLRESINFYRSGVRESGNKSMYIRKTPLGAPQRV